MSLLRKGVSKTKRDKRTGPIDKKSNKYKQLLKNICKGDRFSRVQVWD